MGIGAQSPSWLPASDSLVSSSGFGSSFSMRSLGSSWISPGTRGMNGQAPSRGSGRPLSLSGGTIMPHFRPYPTYRFAKRLPCATATAPGQMSERTATTECMTSSSLSFVYLPLSPQDRMDHAGVGSPSSALRAARSLSIPARMRSGATSSSFSFASIQSASSFSVTWTPGGSWFSLTALSTKLRSGHCERPFGSRKGAAWTHASCVPIASNPGKASNGSSTILIVPLGTGGSASSTFSNQPAVASLQPDVIRAICARRRWRSSPGNHGVDSTAFSKFPVMNFCMLRAAAIWLALAAGKRTHGETASCATQYV
mmetsp:Transcript_29134/g.79975  ORF Transcript_29134/g.79975 Transcript_29134/m.79975 type:complete len:313 (-) Transcript_29134:689-1627(-)